MVLFFQSVLKGIVQEVYTNLTICECLDYSWVKIIFKTIRVPREHLNILPILAQRRHLCWSDVGRSAFWPVEATLAQRQ